MGLTALAALEGEYLWAVAGVLFVFYGIYTMGTVSVSSGVIRRHAIGRRAEIHISDVNEIGLGSRVAPPTRYWIPIIQARDGETIVLNSLMSVSKKKSKGRVIAIRQATGIHGRQADRFAGTNFVLSLIHI